MKNLSFWFLLVLVSCRAGDNDSQAEAGSSATLFAVGPVASVGNSETDPDFQFNGIRGGFVLGGRGVVVADGGSREIRIYNPGMDTVSSFGGSGTGPGMFMQLTAISDAGSLGICGWDSRLGRLSCFSYEGELVLVNSPALDEDSEARFVGVFEDGTSVYEESPSTLSLANQPSGLRRDTTRLVQFDRQGERLRVLATYPGAERHFIDDGISWANHEVIFGRRVFASLRDDMLVVGANDSIDLRTIDSSGREQSVFASAGTGFPVTATMVSERREKLAAELQADLGSMGLIPPNQLMPVIESQKKQITMVHARTTAPGFEGLIIDGEARVWLADPKVNHEAEQRWMIVDLRDNTVTEARFELTGTVLDADGSFLLAVERDGLDRELVRLYSLTEEA